MSVLDVIVFFGVGGGVFAGWLWTIIALAYADLDGPRRSAAVLASLSFAIVAATVLARVS